MHGQRRQPNMTRLTHRDIPLRCYDLSAIGGKADSRNPTPRVLGKSRLSGDAPRRGVHSIVEIKLFAVSCARG
jgi:hypothetical protein